MKENGGKARGKRKKWRKKGEENRAGEGEKSNLPPGVVYVVPVRVFLIVIPVVVVAIVVPRGHRRVSLLPVVVIFLVIVVVIIVVVAGGILLFWDSNERSRRGWLTRWRL